jgi:hypothetical protein
MIDWDAPTWGQDGQNVHYSDTGTWVPDRHNQTSGE